jgi:RNA-directed DNA polymerase
MSQSPNWGTMTTKLTLISEMAMKDKKCCFKNLVHLLDEINLMDCYMTLKTDKANGVDGISVEEYEKKLGSNLKGLVSRMKNQSYKPKPCRRVYIPKVNGKLRPLGIPSTEDKIVQLGIKRILEAIYENDFLEQSYGFRPGRNCHYALAKLGKIITKKPINFIIDADIKGFFDNVDHEWMMKFLQVRIEDKSLLRLIKRFLKSGIMEEGKYSETEKGTPQGGIISPVLANVYLHYVLDLWFEKVVKKHLGKRHTELIRYADDFVICTKYRKDAEKIMNALRNRLRKFGLELSEDKTRLIRFGKSVHKQARKRGKKVDTFNFLGLTHYCKTTRNGKFVVGRKTDRKKLCAKLKEMNLWLKKTRDVPDKKRWWRIIGMKLRGHYQYYGVTGNYRGIKEYYYNVIKMIFKWLNRRSQKKSFTLVNYLKYLETHKLPKPKICHNLFELSLVKF